MRRNFQCKASMLILLALITGGQSANFASANDLRSGKNFDKPSDKSSDKHFYKRSEKDSSEPTDASADFTFKLFAEVCKSVKTNVLISPFSANTALSMVANGASGETLKQMSRVLGASDAKPDLLNARCTSALAKLNASKNVRMEVANAIYTDKKTPFKKEFFDVCTRDYGDAWCNSKTHGKIPSILDRLDQKEKMVLLNAVYFKGAWLRPFENSATVGDKFTTLAGIKNP